MTVAAAFLTPALAYGNIYEVKRPAGWIALSNAPKQIQNDLLREFAECGTPSVLVLSTAKVRKGSYGGAGRNDFYFQFTEDGWAKKFDSEDFPDGGQCTGNYLWSALWFDDGAGGYKQFNMHGNALVKKGSEYLILDVGCGEMPWWSMGRYVRWSAATKSLAPVTKCMKIGAAARWAKANGWR